MGCQGRLCLPSRASLTAARQYGNDAQFDAYDLDGDGVISAEEFLAGAQATKAMNQMDANHDGKICEQTLVEGVT